MNEDFILTEKKKLANLLSNYISLNKEEILEVIKERELSSVFSSPELFKTNSSDIEIINDFVNINKSINLINSVEINREQIHSPENLAEVFRTRYLDTFDKEHINIILFNSKREILDIKEVTKGTINASLVEAREVYKDALINGASKIAICHNHPSGLPLPSPADLEITDKFEKAGDILDIKLLDHIIVGRNSYYSINSMEERDFKHTIDELMLKGKDEIMMAKKEKLVDLDSLNFYTRANDFSFDNNFEPEKETSHEQYLKDMFTKKFKDFVNIIDYNANNLTSDFKYLLYDLKALRDGIESRTYEDLKFIEKFYVFSVKEFYEARNQTQFNYNSMPNYFKTRIEREYNKYINEEYENTNYQAKDKNMVKESTLENELYLNKDFDELQRDEIRKGLESDIDFKKYADPKFSADEMKNIRETLQNIKSLENSEYAQSFDYFELQDEKEKLRVLLDKGNSVENSNNTNEIRENKSVAPRMKIAHGKYPLEENWYYKSTFDEYQKDEIRIGLESGIDPSYYANPDFDHFQMKEIREGLENGVDISKYADTKFNQFQMEEIRKDLEMSNSAGEEISDNKHSYALVKMVAFLDVTGRANLVDEVISKDSVIDAWRVMKENIPEEELVNDFVNMDDGKFLERRNELKKSLSSLNTGLEDICNKHHSKDYINEKESLEQDFEESYEYEEDLEMDM